MANFTASPRTDNGTYVVSLTATDKDGGSTATTKTINVTNAVPTGTLVNAGPVAEGSPVAVSFSAASDPGTADVASLKYSFATDPAALAPDYGTASGSSQSFTFADNGSYTVYGPASTTRTAASAPSTRRS